MNRKTANPPSVAYRFIKAAVRLIYPKTTVVGAEYLPPEPCVIVGNHAQMNGPITCELYSPRPRCTWCAGEMMCLRDVPSYAYRDFWSQKPRSVRWLFKLASYLIAPLSVCVFNGANTIPVYHDSRLLTTFRLTLERLQEGADIVIFPEHDVPCNHILCDFQDKFVDVARLYFKKTGKTLSFVPLYLAPALKKMIYGQPIVFDPNAPIEAERRRICRTCMERITAMAESLPLHTVVPYRNIPKRLYPRNLRGDLHEKTHR